MDSIKNFLRNFLSFSDEGGDEEQQVYMTRVVLLMMAAVLTIVVILITVGWIAGQFILNDLLLVAVMEIGIFAGIWLSWRGNQRMSAYIPILIVFGIGTYGSYSTGFGITSTLLHLTSVLLTGVLISGRSLWVILPVSILTQILITISRFELPFEDVTAITITLTAIFVGISLLQQFSISLLKKSISRSRVLTKEARDARETLAESEMRYRNLVNHAPVSILVHSEGKIVFVNHMAVRVLGGGSEADLLGKSVLDIVHPDDREIARQKNKRIYRKEILASDVFEAKVIRLDGSEILTDLMETATSYNDKPASQVVFIDITTRKQAEEAAQLTQKLADLGSLAAGIAHEMNSPLQVITGLSERYMNLPDSETLSKDIKTINRNAWRIARIIRSLLAYARPSQGKMEPNDMNEVIDDTLLLIEHQLRSWSNITIEKELAENLPIIRCDRNQIAQVLINLLNNAADSMPTGGWIRIRTRTEPGYAGVILQVSDSGSGIPEHIMAKIFDPFFTTKEVGKGTGLGLSVVQGIVQSHGGEIKVESVAKTGTTFTLRFPEAPPEQETDLEMDAEEGRFR